MYIEQIKCFIPKNYRVKKCPLICVLCFYMSSASHNIIIQEDSNHHCYGTPETTELCPLFIVSEDYKGYESIKFTDIKFYPSKVMEQQLYSYKYTWYWRKANFHDGVIVTSKTDLTTENRGVFSHTKKSHDEK